MKILDLIKKPIIVGLMVVVFSLPVVNNMLGNVLPSSELFTNNSLVFTNLIKFLLVTVVYFTIEQFW